MAARGFDLRVSVVLALSGAEVATFTVRSDQIVHSLKKRIKDIEGTSPSRQSLLYGGQLLCSSQTIADVGMHSGDVVHLVRLQEPQLAPPVGTLVGGGILLLRADEIVPSELAEDEVYEYAEWLGMDPEADTDLLWIAREGLEAPLSSPWMACQTSDREVFYFNSETGQSMWEHPVDEEQRSKYRACKAAKTAPHAPPKFGMRLPVARACFERLLSKSRQSFARRPFGRVCRRGSLDLPSRQGHGQWAIEVAEFSD